MANKKILRMLALLLTLAIFGAACASSDEPVDEETQEPGDGGDEAAPTSDTPAAALRAGLTELLQEHVYLAALATGAALRGDNDGFTAFATALNGPSNSNTADLVAAVGSAYGDEVGTAFEGLWRSDGHIPAVVAYTQAVAKDDKAAADKAVADLLAYADTFGETMNQVNENLPADVVAESVKGHITSLKAVIDAQKAGNQPAVYTSLREAFGHMSGTAKALAAATVQKFPDDFAGDSDSPASELRAAFTRLLPEHVFLAASATGGALGGRQAQFEAAAASLNGPSNSNTSDIVAGVGSAYGSEVGTAFDGLWRSDGHIPAVVAYTQAVAGNDKPAADKAVADLLAYADTFGETMNSVNENLPADAVADGVKMHITTLKDVIDAQKAGDPAKTATTLRAAAHHMAEFAAVLSGATVAKFPEKF
ncbi:MAG: hypothetical protein ACT4OM_04590 [Actinomycetota bacterium]